MCWKGVPDWRCLLLRGPLTEGFCADSWDSMDDFPITRPKRTRRLINIDQKRNTKWRRAVETTGKESAELVIYSDQWGEGRDRGEVVNQRVERRGVSMTGAGTVNKLGRGSGWWSGAMFLRRLASSLEPLTGKGGGGCYL